MATQGTSTGKKGMVVGDENFVEALAALADPNDPGSIRVLIDFVLQHNGSFFPPLPDQIEELIKSKLLQAEIAYRQGRAPGLDEQALADVYNLVAARLGLPEPAFTS